MQLRERAEAANAEAERASEQARAGRLSHLDAAKAHQKTAELYRLAAKAASDPLDRAKFERLMVAREDSAAAHERAHDRREVAISEADRRAIEEAERKVDAEIQRQDREDREDYSPAKSRLSSQTAQRSTSSAHEEAARRAEEAAIEADANPSEASHWRAADLYQRAATQLRHAANPDLGGTKNRREQERLRAEGSKYDRLAVDRRAASKALKR